MRSTDDGNSLGIEVSFGLWHARVWGGSNAFNLNIEGHPVYIWVVYKKYLLCGKCSLYKISLIVLFCFVLFAFSMLPVHSSDMWHLTYCL